MAKFVKPTPIGPWEKTGSPSPVYTRSQVQFDGVVRTRAIVIQQHGLSHYQFSWSVSGPWLDASGPLWSTSAYRYSTPGEAQYDADRALNTGVWHGVPYGGGLATQHGSGLFLVAQQSTARDSWQIRDFSGAQIVSCAKDRSQILRGYPAGVAAATFASWWEAVGSEQDPAKIPRVQFELLRRLREAIVDGRASEAADDLQVYLDWVEAWGSPAEREYLAGVGRRPGDASKMWITSVTVLGEERTMITVDVPDEIGCAGERGRHLGWVRY